MRLIRETMMRKRSTMYYTGRGVTHSFEEAARRPRAIFNSLLIRDTLKLKITSWLMMYHRGTLVTHSRPRQAACYFRLASDQGDDDAQNKHDVLHR